MSRRRATLLAAAVTLAAPGVARADDAAEARAEARRVLEQGRFHESRPPSLLEPITDWIGDLFDKLHVHIPVGTGAGLGSNLVVLGLMAAVVCVLAWLVTTLLLGRRIAKSEKERPDAAGRGEDRRSLERAAAEAERRGDFELAVRLLFRAGLAGLQRARVVPARDSLTSREIGRAVRLPDFDRLASMFDQVVYGGRDASTDDVQKSRRAWETVIKVATRR